MRRLVVWTGFLVLLAIPGARAAGDVPGAGAGLPPAGELPPPAQRLPAPEHVPSETRAELGARMGRHAATMSNLVRSVVLLDRPTIRALATRIADEESIARAGRPVSERKRSTLPPEFFAEQSALTTVARELAVAAADGSDDRTLADRFAALTRSCVSCHSVYLHGRPESQPLGPKGR